MTVEILYVAGCPNADPARELIRQTLAQLGVRAEVLCREVPDESRGAVRGFAGSPTVLVNGRDVEPAATTGFACRIYAHGAGVPSREACVRAIAQALEEEGKGCNEVL